MVPRTLPDLIETDLGDFRAALRGTTLAVLDFETSDVRPRIAVPAGLGVYLPEPDRVFYLNVGHTRRDEDVPLWKPAALARVLRPFLRRRSNRIVMHNATFDLRMLLKLGLDVLCRVSDTLILTHRLDENLRSHSREPTYRAYLDRVGYGLKDLTLTYFNRRPPTLHGTVGPRNTLSASPAEVARYCAQDVVNTFNLYARATAHLAADPVLEKLVRKIDDPNHLPLARMMWEGVQIDADEGRHQQDAYLLAIQNCRDAIWETVGVAWPLDKPKDLLRVLRHLNFKEDLHYDPFADPWASKSDPRDPGEDYDPSVTMELLEDLQAASDSPEKKLVVGLLLSKWQMQQRLSAFVSPLPELVRYTDNRLYLDRFASTLVTTRFSSSPNLQNLPKRADKVDPEGGWRSLLTPGCAESHTTRNLFVARPGHTLVSIDLSAAEPRYLAMLFQKALKAKDEAYYQEVRELHARRLAKYPDLMIRMEATREPYHPQPCPVCGTPLYVMRAAGRLRQHCIVCNSFPLEIQ
jgi:DNA polymerase I-like protein with 3'-5' exonuclease and polymerase domains